MTVCYVSHEQQAGVKEVVVGVASSCHQLMVNMPVTVHLRPAILLAVGPVSKLFLDGGGDKCDAIVLLNPFIAVTQKKITRIL